MDFVHCRKKKEKKNIIKIQSGLLEENLPQQNWAQSLHALCFTAFAANGTRPRTASRRDLAVTWNNKTELFPQQTCWLLGAGGKRRCNINDGSLPVRWPSKPCQWASMDINEALALAQLKRNAAIINVSCYTCVCHDRIPRQEEGLWLEMFSCIRSVFYWNIQDIFPYVYQRVLYILYLFEVKTSATHSIKKKKTWQQSRFPQTFFTFSMRLWSRCSRARDLHSASTVFVFVPSKSVSLNACL